MVTYFRSREKKIIDTRVIYAYNHLEVIVINACKSLIFIAMFLTNINFI